jgi:hypothetical protein
MDAGLGQPYYHASIDHQLDSILLQKRLCQRHSLVECQIKARQHKEHCSIY